jgi:hypothetical protein
VVCFAENERIERIERIEADGLRSVEIYAEIKETQVKETQVKETQPASP